MCHAGTIILNVMDMANLSFRIFTMTLEGDCGLHGVSISTIIRMPVTYTRGV